METTIKAIEQIQEDKRKGFVSSFIREFNNDTVKELEQLGYTVEQYDEFLFVRW